MLLLFRQSSNILHPFSSPQLLTRCNCTQKKLVPCMPMTKRLPPCAPAWESAPLLGHHRNGHTSVFPKHSPSGCSLALSSKHSKSHRLAAGYRGEMYNVRMLHKASEVHSHCQFSRGHVSGHGTVYFPMARQGWSSVTCSHSLLKILFSWEWIALALHSQDRLLCLYLILLI